MTIPKEATREALPDLDKTRMLGYHQIRYVAGYPESYVKEYAAALLESERQAHAAEIAGLRAKAARYDWLRECDWFDSELCVLRDPKRVLTRGIGLGADCPSSDRLDAAELWRVNGFSSWKPAQAFEGEAGEL